MADTTSVRLPTQIVDEIRLIAKAYDRSLSAQLRVALQAYIRGEGPEARRILAERRQ
ncbi:MAG: hypothetical protein ACLP3C_29655 [Mycobacterium sp.]|uniref:hypothetical protein n=1 Tax=Mycobacterium sp. TaxID=1785 RepID=UPI003F98641A